MITLTIDVDEATFESAKSAADGKGISVDKLVLEYLASISNEQRISQREVIERIVELAKASKSGSGPEGRTWTREDIYEDAMSRQRPDEFS